MLIPRMESEVPLMALNVEFPADTPMKLFAIVSDVKIALEGGAPVVVFRAFCCEGLEVFGD